MTAKSRHRRPINQTQVVTSGTVIRMEEPSSDRRQKPNPAMVMVHDYNPVDGFVSFLREYAVVGLAVGFVIGTQAQGLVKQLVASFLDPASQLLFGRALSQRTFTLHLHGHVANFGWGGFIYALINFVFVLAAVFAVVKLFNLDKFDKPKPEPEK